MKCDDASVGLVGRHGSFKKMQQQLNNALIMDTEASVMANFEFLGPSEMSDDDEICDDLDMVVGGGDNDEMDIKPSKRNKMSRDILNEGECVCVVCYTTIYI